MGEVEAHLMGPLGMTSVRWPRSPELAMACRTGFAPGDRAGIIEALAQRAVDAGVNADVPWAMAGPSGADATVRHYNHDAWNSISSTIKLPNRGVRAAGRRERIGLRDDLVASDATRGRRLRGRECQGR
jgi:hypothetical protein